MVWCPDVSCSGFEISVCLRFSTLNFSTFLIIKVMLSRLYNDVKRLFESEVIKAEVQ